MEATCFTVIMSERTLVVQAGRTWRWWGLLRVALVLLWLFVATMNWWTAPRKQTYDQAGVALSAGHVTAYQWGDRWDADSPRLWLSGFALRSSGTLGLLFVWRTSDGRVYWIHTNDYDQVTNTGKVDEDGYSGAGAVAVAENIQAAGLEHRNGDVEPYGGVLNWAGLVLGLVAVGAVVAGPTPARGTRWYWFWLVYITPFGLGLLFWLARDRPWSRSAAPSVFGGPERRRRGAVGLGVGIIAAILISILQLILHNVLGDRWVPNPNV